MIYKNIELHNVADIEESSFGTRLCRIPDRAEVFDNPELVANTSWHCAGVELRFNILGGKAEITLFSQGDAYYTGGIIEIYYGEYPAYSTVTPVKIDCGQKITLTIPKPVITDEIKSLMQSENHRYDYELVRVVLPFDRKICLVGIKGDLEPPRENQVTKRRLLCYGSSITHGFFAVRTLDTYPARMAKLLNMDYYNLGFGGTAYMDPALAKHISALDWDAATFEMGINVYGSWTLEFFESRVSSFMKTITDAKKESLTVGIDMYRHIGEFTGGENERAGLYRAVVRKCLAGLACDKVWHMEAYNIISTSDMMSNDFLHPCSYGFGLMADRIAQFIQKHM